MHDVLVVDDDHLLGETVVSLLETEGFSAAAIDDPSMIGDTIKREHPKVIVLDYFLPGANGAVIAQQLKKDTLTKDIPIIMISSSYGIEPVVRMAGVDAFLPKPFDVGTLVSLINQVTVS
jgi:DNA-binding response OmpR family regulator